MFQLRKFYGSKFDRFNAIVESLHGQLTTSINLIGSATLPLPEVCTAQSLPGSSCRVEGHLGARYFPGTQTMDEAEKLAEESVAEIFALPDDYEINVQPHSATQANHAVWNSFLKTGDTVMGLDLDDGGHISHKLGLPNGVQFLPFQMANEGIDYVSTSKLVTQTKPKMIICGGSSYPLNIQFKSIFEMTAHLNTHLHADLAHTGPFIAAGLHDSPFPYFDTVTLDTGKNFRGPKGGILIFKKGTSKSVKRSIFPIIQSSPNQSAILAKACTFEYWRNSSLSEYANSLIHTAKILSEALTQHNVPVIFGGTDCHLILIDAGQIGITGKIAEERLEGQGILANRNSIPGDSLPPQIGSGLRIGTTTLTILGYSDSDLFELARVISSVLRNNANENTTIIKLLQKYHSQVSQLI